MGVAPAVAETGGQQFAHLGPLLIGKAGVEMVGGRVLQVDLLVGHVHIAADHDALAGRQLLDVGPESIFPLHSVVEAAQTVL